MGSKNSKQQTKQDSGSQGAQSSQVGNLPIESVSDRQRAEQKRQKAIDRLETIYVDVPKNGEKQQIIVPPEGAKVVVRGEQGQKVKMTPQPVAKTNKANTVKVIRTYPGRGGVVYAQPEIKVIKTDGSQTTDNIVVVRQAQPVVYCDPYPYYYPYYGPYRYGYPYRYYYW